MAWPKSIDRPPRGGGGVKVGRFSPLEVQQLDMYEKENRIFCLNYFNIFNLAFKNFIVFKLAIYWYFFIWFLIKNFYSIILVFIFTISFTSIVRMMT